MLKIFFKLINKLDVYWKNQELLASFASFGMNFRFDPKSTFIDAKNMNFGDNVFINRRAHFSGDITVGNDVMFGPNVSIFAHDHYFAITGKQLYEIEAIKSHKPVVIGNHCWIGANVTMVGGAKISVGSVVAAASVVIGVYPPFCLLAGNPARPIRKIFSDEELILHLNGVGLSPQESEAILENRTKNTVGLSLKSIRQEVDANK